MIDYEKLKLAHELAEKIHGKIHYQIMENSGACSPFFYLDDLITKLKKLTQDKPKPKYEVGQNVWTFTFSTINEWVIESIYWEPELNDFRVNLKGECGKAASLVAEKLYPSKQELIESQIEYWCSQLDLKDEIEYWAKQPKFGGPEIFSDAMKQHSDALSSCRKNQESSTQDEDMSTASIGGFELSKSKIEDSIEKWKKSDIQSNQVQPDIDRCQHESDGKAYDIRKEEKISAYEDRWFWVKYKHCGEFYK